MARAGATWVAAAAALLLFAWLAHAVGAGETPAADIAVREAVHAWARPPLTAAMRAITLLGTAGFMVPASIAVVALLVCIRRVRAAPVFSATLVGAEALEVGLKLVFARPRPEAFFGYPAPSSFSFPSGHAVISGCFCALIVVLFAPPARRVWWWLAAMLAAGLIGFSRIYLGVHYASDVAAGYLLAAAWTTAAVRVGFSKEDRRAASPA